MIYKMIYMIYKISYIIINDNINYQQRDYRLKNTNRVSIACGCSVTKPCPTLCNPVDYSMPGFPVLHYLSDFAQTRVY